MHKRLADADRIAITMHIRPDGDSIGTALALRLVLRQMGKTADVYAEGDLPEHFHYISGFDEIINCADCVPKPASIEMAEGDNSGGCDDSRYNLLVIVDVAETKRVGMCAELKARCDGILVIDHHLNPTIEADTIVTNPLRASCGEMLFEYFIENKIELSADIATALYTSISSDTGCFLFPNTTWYTHHVAAKLLQFDIDVATINYNNFRVYNPKILDGLMRVLRRIEFLDEGRIAITCIDYRMVKKFNFTHDERHRFMRYASDASGVKVSIFLTEQERGTFNVSLRSHGDVNVAQAAASFGGGGHKNAAGLLIEGRYKNVIKKLLTEVRKVIL